VGATGDVTKGAGVVDVLAGVGLEVVWAAMPALRDSPGWASAEEASVTTTAKVTIAAKNPAVLKPERLDEVRSMLPVGMPVMLREEAWRNL